MGDRACLGQCRSSCCGCRVPRLSSSSPQSTGPWRLWRRDPAPAVQASCPRFSPQGICLVEAGRPLGLGFVSPPSRGLDPKMTRSVREHRSHVRNLIFLSDRSTLFRRRGADGKPKRRAICLAPLDPFLLLLFFFFEETDIYKRTIL